MTYVIYAPVSVRYETMMYLSYVVSMAAKLLNELMCYLTQKLAGTYSMIAGSDTVLRSVCLQFTIQL